MKTSYVIVLKNHTISKRGEARSIIIKKDFEKLVIPIQGKDVIVFIKSYPAFNSQISYSAPSYYITIPSKHTEKIQKYFGKSLDIIIKLSEKVSKT